MTIFKSYYFLLGNKMFQICLAIEFENLRATYKILFLTDIGEDSRLVHRRKRPKVDTLFSTLFFRRVRATSMTQRRVQNTRVHFWTFLPVSVKKNRVYWLHARGRTLGKTSFFSRRVVQMINSRKESVNSYRNLCFINYIFARKIIEVHLTILVQFFASSITIICGSRDCEIKY